MKAKIVIEVKALEAQCQAHLKKSENEIQCRLVKKTVFATLLKISEKHLVK